MALITLWHTAPDQARHTPIRSPLAHCRMFNDTGEMMDGNGLEYLRARYYAPGLGVFTSLDLIDNINRYQYVGGNSANLVDPSGMFSESPELWDNCLQREDDCQNQPGQTGDFEKDRWLYELGFCTPKNPSATAVTFPTDFKVNKDLRQVAQKIQEIFGFQMTGLVSREDVATTAHGSWLVARALGERLNESGEALFRDVFRDIRVHYGFDASGFWFPFDSPSFWAIAVGGAYGVVPPPSFGGTGKDVYLKGGIGYEPTIFIHELGHVLDFKLGTWYEEDDLANSLSPSADLYRATGGKYNLSGCGLLPWNACVVLSRDSLPGYNIPDVYTEGDTPTWYGGKNHYEDFAETWTTWVLWKSEPYRDTSSPSYELKYDFLAPYPSVQVADRDRVDFVDRHMLTWVVYAGRR